LIEQVQSYVLPSSPNEPHAEIPFHQSTNKNGVIFTNIIFAINLKSDTLAKIENIFIG